ncbi:MAG: MoaD/ThiS family protein [Betaproteobacteria bacterium]|nr:MoaD/ThiS family protein [Betaproteobacteria bacterium]
MNLQLLYFARLRETFGLGGERLQLDEGATVADLLLALRARGGVWAAELAPERAWRVAVDQEVAGPETALREGAEVAVFPPVTGG